MRLPPGPTAGARRNLQHRVSHARTLRTCSRRGVRIEPRRPRHHQGKGSQQRDPGRLTLSLPMLSKDAAPLWTRVSPLPMQQRLEETRRRRHSIANPPATDTKSHACVTKAFNIDLLSGRRMGDTRPSHKHCSKLQTSHPAGMASRCRLNRSSADGDMRNKLLFFAAELP